MSRQKNKLPLFIGLAAAGAALYLYLRNKAAAGQNLRVEPLDALINTARTRESLFTRLYYTVKLRLVNDEPAAVVVRGLNLSATANGRPFGNLVSADAFTVPAKSAQTVSLNASVSTFGALGAILDILRGGRSVSVSIVGYVDTDLGRVNVEYQTELSAAGVNSRQGVNGPTYKYAYKVTDCLDANDCLIALKEMNEIKQRKGGKLNRDENNRVRRLLLRLRKFTDTQA